MIKNIYPESELLPLIEEGIPLYPADNIEEEISGGRGDENE